MSGSPMTSVPGASTLSKIQQKRQKARDSIRGMFCRAAEVLAAIEDIYEILENLSGRVEAANLKADRAQNNRGFF